MTRTKARTTCFLLITAILCFGCSPLPTASFALSLGEGDDLPLYAEPRSSESAAGIIIGSGTQSATYTLKDPAVLPGQHPALEIRYTLDGAARLDLFARDGRSKPFLSLELARGAGELRWRLDLPPGSSLARLRFTPLSRGGAEDRESPSRLSVIGVSVREAEYGIETDPEARPFPGGPPWSETRRFPRNPRRWSTRMRPRTIPSPSWPPGRVGFGFMPRRAVRLSSIFSHRAPRFSPYPPWGLPVSSRRRWKGPAPSDGCMSDLPYG